MTDTLRRPPAPLHRWASNETMKDVPYKFDRCLACQVRRESPEAARACPAATTEDQS